MIVLPHLSRCRPTFFFHAQSYFTLETFSLSSTWQRACFALVLDRPYRLPLPNIQL